MTDNSPAPMVRKNYFFDAVQIARLTKLAKREGKSVAALMREAADMLITDRVAKLRAAQEAASE